MYKTILADETLVATAVKESRSLGEALDRLSIVRGGKTYAAFREACDAYGLDYTFPDRYRTQRIPLEEVLVEDSTYVNNRINIKKYVLEAGLLKNVCSLCGLGPVWNDIPLVLQLDHINGKNNDHRIENLRILCPNCHTQTETYAGRSRK